MQKFIGESAVYQEAEIIKIEPQKAIFKIVLQTADDINQNKRMYPKKVLVEAMKNAEDRINKRRFMGECDHPLISGVEATDGIRQTTVMLKEAAVLIRNYEFQGNKLVGELETLRTPNGRIILGLLQDRVTIGTSLRGLAELEHKNGVNVVQAPLYTIAYDMVSLPSHVSSIVNFSEMTFENKNLLTESNCGTICLPNGICYLSNYVDMLIETKVIKFFDRWV